MAIVLDTNINKIIGVSGTPLQFVSTSNTTQFSTSTQYTYINLHSITITAAGNNSKYFLDCHQQVYHNATGGRTGLGWSVTVNGTTTRLVGTDGSSGDTWSFFSYPGMTGRRPYVSTSTAAPGTTLTFTLLGGMFDVGTTTWCYTGYGMVSHLYVTEIAA